MSEVSIIGLDIAKNVFHAHGADASGRALFSRKIVRFQRDRTTLVPSKELQQLPSADLAAEQCSPARIRAVRMKNILRGGVITPLEEASVLEVSIIGLDIAKNVF